MFFKWNDGSIRLVGRWGTLCDESISATTTGAMIEFEFIGSMALVYFDVITNEQPYPHLWIQVDGGAKIECPLDAYLRIATNSGGSHNVKIIYKGGVERHHRWYEPLTGKVTFKGYEAEGSGILPEDNRKIIEFVGDSITEGVLIDDNYSYDKVPDGQLLRVYQDDVCATYAWLVAQELNLKPIFMGYGAVGMTKGGMGAVPKASKAYPFVFNNCEVDITPDYVLINHGANDSKAISEEYISEYEITLNLIRKIHPRAKIISLSAFCGIHNEALGKFIEKYNESLHEKVIFIDSKGWIAKSPLHPNRKGHIAVAEKLIPILKEFI